MTPALYVVPNLLGVVPPHDVLPERTIAIARAIEHWVVETPKAARAFLKTIAPGRAVSELSITAIDDARDGVAKLLAPIFDGRGVGLLSDAGCPGVADPGAALVAAAHAANVAVVPLVGPSSILLALMAAGMNGQRFTFHGYLPAKPDARAAALRGIESDARTRGTTGIFIETPYRNAQMLATIVATLAPATRVCVAADLTLATESVVTRPVREWRAIDAKRYERRPAMFLVSA
jgi:16S rRNA (cytidine1402-2'-O)-methyltransferase